MNGALLAYAPFLYPLPIWDRNWLWALLLVPLCAAVAVVYKSIRCSQMSRVPREALVLFITIVAGMIVAAAALAGLTALME
jgi:hypothetical protein